MLCYNIFASHHHRATPVLIIAMRAVLTTVPPIPSGISCHLALLNAWQCCIERQPAEYQKSALTVRFPKRSKRHFSNEMLHMLPYPQSCQGQRKDREEAKDILAECVQGIAGFSVDRLNDPSPLGEYSIVVQAMILLARGLSCSAVICHVLFLEPVMLAPFVWIPKQGSKTLMSQALC